MERRSIRLEDERTAFSIWYVSSTLSVTDLLSLEQIGPIIRINPHELHVIDPEYIDEIFAGAGRKRDKYKWVTRMATSISFVGPVA